MEVSERGTTAVFETEESDGYHIIQRRAEREGDRQAQIEARGAKPPTPAGAWHGSTRLYISPSCLPRSHSLHTLLLAFVLLYTQFAVQLVYFILFIFLIITFTFHLNL